MIFSHLYSSRRFLAPGGSFLLPHSSRSIALFVALCAVSPRIAHAQDAAPASPLENAPASPKAAPSPAESVNSEGTSESPVAAPETQVPEAEEAADAVPEVIVPAVNARDGASSDAPVSRLFAESVSKNGDLIIAEGSNLNPARFETAAGTITAVRVQLNIEKQLVEANGMVRLERQVQTSRRALTPRGLLQRRTDETATETLQGQNLRFDFKTQAGTLDNAEIQLAALSISAQSLSINGRRYSAQNVLIRPGALSPAETQIYGTPPFNIRAKTLEATLADPQAAGAAGAGNPNVVARGGGLYFRNTKILPLPAYIFRAGLGGGGGEESAFQLTPGISFNSADRILLTTRLSYPLSKVPGQLSSFADIGLSQRIGVRGGVGLESSTPYGSLKLSARRSDVVETQLTNRIELDRKPEISFSSPAFLTFDLPGHRRAGFTFSSSYGDYGERNIGESSSTVEATRLSARLLFTTRLRAVDGAFLRLFASTARYGGVESRYESRGFEVGYDGQLLSRVRGQISLRSTNLSGETPFRFDRVEIARELRTTFDIEITPRYLLPVDLRYDLTRRDLRDASFGILRSYKVFAYGIVYQTASQDLRFQVRQGF